MKNPAITNKLDEGCLQCLKYFGIFKYPLTPEEVHLFNPIPSTIKEVQNTIDHLREKGIVYQSDEFYMLEDNLSWVAERRKGNLRAGKLLSGSSKYVRIISSFPFVKAIAISGSLSKFYASDQADIDYFIITEKNRLWISRTLLHLFKKLTFLTHHQHYFCMNYFVDTSALEITHPNQYSAIETVTLLPVYNEAMIVNFMEENQWVKRFLPNFQFKKYNEYLISETRKPIKHLFEKFFNILAPEKLNHFLMRLTDKKWRRKWSGHGYSSEDYNRAFQTEISISKNHPIDFEKKVLNQLSNSNTNQMNSQ